MTEREHEPAGSGAERAEPAAPSAPPGPSTSWVSVAALCAAVIAVYVVVLPTGFLSYDDPWLVVANRMLDNPSPKALGSVWGAFDQATRLELGAEYLPVRDTLSWVLVRLAGKSAPAFHLAQLATYLGAVLFVRAWLARVLERPAAAELAAWLFALHPAHVSSVAWIAGWKDALALFFASAAMAAHARASTRQGSRTSAAAVALLTALACLSKGVAVVTPAFLLLGDVLARRRVGWERVLASGAVALGSVALQLAVGRVVGMLAEPLGGGPAGAVASMAPVAFRYLGVSLLVDPPCIVRTVEVHSLASPVALASLAGIAAAVAWAGLAWRRRGERVPLAAVGLFAAGLAPVSQVLAPLQNRMADRYLLFAVLGPCVALAVALTTRLRAPLARLAGGALALAAAMSSALHAWEFSDERRLWESALAREPSSPLPAFQLGRLELERGELGRAEVLLRRAITQDGFRSEVSSRATTNLSRILAATGHTNEAIDLLRTAVERFPDEPRPLNNLATLLHERGDHAEARALFERLVARFPAYEGGVAAYTSRYGAPPSTSPGGRAPPPAAP